MSDLYVNRISSVDSIKLKVTVQALLAQLNAHSTAQISLTSSTGQDLWEESVGRMTDLKFPERYYSFLNDTLKNTYIDEIVTSFPKYYRWRLLRLEPMSTYTVHRDSLNGKRNIRLHIPVITNQDSYLCFYDKKPSDGNETVVSNYHLVEGSAYEVNTSDWHTAVNYGSSPRYHIVAVRYE